MVIGGLMAFMLAARQQATPALWLNLRGEVLLSGKPFQPRITPGANRFKTRDGYVYNFSGQRGGILFPDLPDLALTGSITVSTWIYPRSYVNDGPGAEILFRGDDRCGYDAYWLVIQSDGTLNFCVGNEKDQAMRVSGELALNRWTHVTANFDVSTGSLNLWLDGVQVGYAKTWKRPFAQLDRTQAPGLGVGNVQNDRGPHNQPFNGMLADLRLYGSALPPEAVGWAGRSKVDVPVPQL